MVFRRVFDTISESGSLVTPGAQPEVFPVSLDLDPVQQREAWIPQPARPRDQSLGTGPQVRDPGVTTGRVGDKVGVGQVESAATTKGGRTNNTATV